MNLYENLMRCELQGEFQPKLCLKNDKYGTKPVGVDMTVT
jgi:hypothetical protein